MLQQIAAVLLRISLKPSIHCFANTPLQNGDKTGRSFGQKKKARKYGLLMVQVRRLELPRGCPH